jgi:hypothetical protein
MHTQLNCMQVQVGLFSSHAASVKIWRFFDQILKKNTYYKTFPRNSGLRVLLRNWHHALSLIPCAACRHACFSTFPSEPVYQQIHEFWTLFAKISTLQFPCCSQDHRAAWSSWTAPARRRPPCSWRPPPLSMSPGRGSEGNAGCPACAASGARPDPRGRAARKGSPAWCRRL